MSRRDVTYESSTSGLTPALERNIEALVERRRREQAAATLQDRIADRITGFTGSMVFVYVHITIFGLWIVINLRWIPGLPAWDESFVVLAMAASVEAIFLSTFVLITQNRIVAESEKRADLDLQISLLTEHELTKVAALVASIADTVGAKHEGASDIEQVKKDVAPEAVLDRIEKTKP